MAFLDSAMEEPGQSDAGGGGGPPGGAPGGAPGGEQAPPPPGGGPILAALARRNLSPPVSAPGPGNIASGLMLLKNAVDMIHQALPSLESGSKPYTDAINALKALSRHLPQGASTAGVQQTQLGDLMRNTARNALLQRIMAQRGGGGGGAAGGAGGAGAGGGAQGGMPPPQPSPSTPLPGA